MKYLIVGVGKSGLAAKDLLLLQGIPKECLSTFDDKNSAADFKDGLTAMRVFNPDVIVVSPGYPLSTPWLQAAKASGHKITSEINLACPHLTDEKIIGITGSLGKSTTVALLGAGAKFFDKNVFVGGNFGVPLAEYASGVLSGKRPRAQWLIVELSSFQLENSADLQLDFAGITYFASNHLERYSNKEEYFKTKWDIQNHKRDSVAKCPLYLNANSPELLEYFNQNESKSEKELNTIHLVKSDALEIKKFCLGESKLIGTHNQDNLSLAAKIALDAGWPTGSIEAMKNFSGLPHRLENLGVHGGVLYINDSKATAIESVLTAVMSCLQKIPPDKGNLYVLIGGQDKQLPWEKLKELKKFKNLNSVFFGECGFVAAKKSELSGSQFTKLGEAVSYCVGVAKPDDIVLLSPGGTSRDEFANFEVRGDYFRSIVCNS